MMKNHISKLLTVFFSISMLLTLIGFVSKKDYRPILGLIAIYICYILFICVENKMKVKMKNYIKALVFITIILHTSLGQYFNLYKTTNWFDNTLHVFGTFSFSLFYYSIINSTTNYSTESKIFTFIFISSVGITTGVFFELIEFILDFIYKTKHQHGLMDTNLDLIFNILGSTLAGAMVVFKNVDFTE